MTLENTEAQTPTAEVVTQAVTEAVAQDPEIIRLTQELTQAKGALSGRDRRITELTKKTQQDENLKNDIASLKSSIDDRMELLAAAIENKLGINGNELEEVIPKETRTSVTADLKARIAKEKLEAEQRKAIEILSPIQTRVEALGLKPDDDDYIAIQSLAITMNPKSIALAEKKLVELEAKKETTKVPVESEEVRIAKLVKEGIEKSLIEERKKMGLNVDESNVPSGNKVVPEGATDKIRSGWDKRHPEGK